MNTVGFLDVKLCLWYTFRDVSTERPASFLQIKSLFHANVIQFNILMLYVKVNDLTRIKPNKKREKLCERRARACACHKHNPFFLFLLFFEIKGCVLRVRAHIHKFSNICKVRTNVTVKHVREGTVPLKKQEVLHMLCVCSLN